MMTAIGSMTMILIEICDFGSNCSGVGLSKLSGCAGCHARFGFTPVEEVDVRLPDGKSMKVRRMVKDIAPLTAWSCRPQRSSSPQNPIPKMCLTILCDA